MWLLSDCYLVEEFLLFKCALINSMSSCIIVLPSIRSKQRNKQAKDFAYKVLFYNLIICLSKCCFKNIISNSSSSLQSFVNKCDCLSSMNQKSEQAKICMFCVLQSNNLLEQMLPWNISWSNSSLPESFMNKCNYYLAEINSRCFWMHTEQFYQQRHVIQGSMK
jgi:hypothetical protein